MTQASPAGSSCAHCGTELSGSPVTDDAGTMFCSAGCRDVYRTLGADTVTSDHATSDRSDGSPVESSTHPQSVPSAAATTFLRVDGLNSSPGEAYLERVAERHTGIYAAEASYVTETIRIEHDPDEVSVATLSDALSITGYEAIPRDEAPIDTEARTASGARQFDSVVGYRYAVGVLFGSFLMLSYIVLVYPAQLSALLGPAVLPTFAGTGGLGGSGSLLILPLYFVLTGVVLVFTGTPLLRSAYVSLKMRQPTTELLVATTIVGAYAYSTLAIIFGRTDVYYDLTMVIAAIVVAAIFYESLVKQQALDQLTDLTVSHVDEATLYTDNETTTTVPIADVEPGDRVLVRPGERVPVDGTLHNDGCTVDEAVVTGESLPVRKHTGDDMIGGAIVSDGVAIVEVGADAESSVERLISSVWALQSTEHGVQRRANRLAGYSFPVIGGAVLIAGVLGGLFGGGLGSAVLGGLTATIVVVPWALGFATPLSIAASLRTALQHGIVIFDETVFERLRSIDVVVFDKTGTLTTGDMQVLDADAPAEILEAVAMLEQRASHPVAEAIVEAYGSTDPDHSVDNDHATPVEQTTADGKPDPGVHDVTIHDAGIEGAVAGDRVLAGTLGLFDDHGWTVPADLEARIKEARGVGRVPVVVGRNGQATGLILVGDEPRTQWRDTVERLDAQDIDVVVLTGDDSAATAVFEEHPAVTHVFADVPPSGKTATIDRLQADQSVTMVGDGTNDAPALAQADLGISLGGGTAIAADAADITLVEPDLTSVETAFTLARRANQRVRQNTALAFVYNLVTVPLAIGGLLNPLLTMAAVLVTGGIITANAQRAFSLND